MKKLHVKEILEALRGKTIVDSIRLSYELPLSDMTIIRLEEVSGILTKTKSNTLDLIFQPDFLTYVQWQYFSAVEQAQKVTGTAKTLDIYGHQLFDDQNHNFALRFNEREIIFQNRSNIEDTLFLDIQRYCEHNRINYVVK